MKIKVNVNNIQSQRVAAPRNTGRPIRPIHIRGAMFEGTQQS